jgi:hypothetical protein
LLQANFSNQTVNLKAITKLPNSGNFPTRGNSKGLLRNCYEFSITEHLGTGRENISKFD